MTSSVLGPGSRIADRYAIESPLASGGMGVVYRATDTRLSRPVAIKLLLAQLGAEPSQLARFEREAIAAARLSHPGIVQVHDFGRTETGLSYLVMELVGGTTLAKVLDGSRLTTPRALDVGEQALSALAAAHAAGIVHRDLKPGNIMLVPLGGGREHVKLLDFGIAQLKSGEGYARLTATGEILGTPSFMAPEQARGESCDPRTDVYAMGMVLWCCVTGRLPYAQLPIAKVVTALQTEMPPRADAISAEVSRPLADVIEKAMQKSPTRRFGSADELAAALRSTAQAKTTGTPMIPATRPQSAAPSIPTVPERPAALGPSAPAPALPPAPIAARAPAVSPVPVPVQAPVATPAPVSAPVHSPAPVATPVPASAAVDSAAASAPQPRKPRWWLRILLALLALGLLAVLAVVAVIVAIGVWGLEAFASLPNAEHPAAGIVDAVSMQTCEAAARCCVAAGGSSCDAYRAPPLDVASCRRGIGSFGDTLLSRGEDAQLCSPTYSGP
ncbi:MAG: serine/threonine-protein kinase [Sandaracinus sp.]